MNNASKQRVKNSRLAGGKSIGLRKSTAKELNSSRCHSGFGRPADLDPPRSKSASGYGPPPFADLDPLPKFPFKHPLYHIWLLILFASFLSMFFSITTQHFRNEGKKN